jgi:hypothetical protein
VLAGAPEAVEEDDLGALPSAPDMRPHARRICGRRAEETHHAQSIQTMVCYRLFSVEAWALLPRGNSSGAQLGNFESRIHAG